MTTRTKEEWHAIMDARSKSTLSNADFCREHNIPIQTFYARRHAMGLATPMNKKRQLTKTEPKLIKARVVAQPSSVVVQTHYAQVSLSSQCDPLWLAALLKGLAP